MTTLIALICVAGIAAGQILFKLCAEALRTEGLTAVRTMGLFFAAMTLGYFDRSMGLEQPGRDHAWLAAWGVAVAAIMLVPIAALHHDPLRLAPAALGALVSAAYAASKAIGGRWTDRAEWFAGAIFGTAISLAAYG
jgi:hypothetical protein